MLAGNHAKRNALAFINNGISFIHSKIRVVKALETTLEQAPKEGDEELSQ